jgi:hypothetical protein
MPLLQGTRISGAWTDPAGLAPLTFSLTACGDVGPGIADSGKAASDNGELPALTQGEAGCRCTLHVRSARDYSPRLQLKSASPRVPSTCGVPAPRMTTDVEKLRARVVRVQVSGAGSVQAYASEQIAARVAGVGSIGRK